LPPTLVHGTGQLDNGGVSATHVRGFPATRSKQHKGIEYPLVKTRGVGEGRVTPLNSGGQPLAQGGIFAKVAREMGETECDVTRLVLRREPCDLARADVRGMVADEP
jgi:hypothetical protein